MCLNAGATPSSTLLLLALNCPDDEDTKDLPWPLGSNLGPSGHEVGHVGFKVDGSTEASHFHILSGYVIICNSSWP